MPYPTKRTAEQVLGAALTLFRRGGDQARSMRLLAERLDVRPSSLYHYYPERGAHTEAHAAFVAAHSYLAYARAQPHLYSPLYSLLFAPKAPHTAEVGPGKNLWDERRPPAH